MCPHPSGDKSPPPSQRPGGGGPKHSLEEPPCRQSRGRLSGPNPALLLFLAPPGQGCGSGWQQGPVIWLLLPLGHSCRQGRGCALPGGWRLGHCAGVRPSQRGRGGSLRHPIPSGAAALIRVPPAATGPASHRGSGSQSQRAGNFLLPRRASHGGGSDFPARTSLPRPSTSHSGRLLGPRGRGVMAAGAPRPLPGL